MVPAVYQITTQMLYQGALLFAILDALIIPVLVWRVDKNRFRQAKWELVALAGIFWFGIWRWATTNYWEKVYQYVFPDWARSIMPLFFGLLMAGIGLIIWELARRFKFQPVIGNSLLSGLWAS